MNLNVSGVSTFVSNVNLSANLDVDGQTDLDILNVAETATFASNIDANGNLDVDGQTDLDVLNVAEPLHSQATLMPMVTWTLMELQN